MMTRRCVEQHSPGISQIEAFREDNGLRDCVHGKVMIRTVQTSSRHRQ